MANGGVGRYQLVSLCRRKAKSPEVCTPPADAGELADEYPTRTPKTLSDLLPGMGYMPSPSILDQPARLARQPEFGARAGEGYAPTSARASIPVYRSVISHRVSRQHVGLAESWRGRTC